MVTCGLTACTPGSAPGPTLGTEYEKPLPFYIIAAHLEDLLTDNMKVSEGHGVFGGRGPQHGLHLQRGKGDASVKNISREVYPYGNPTIFNLDRVAWSA